MKTGPVILPLNLARCPSTRTQPCMNADTCARALVDSKGRDTYDFSASPRGAHGQCLTYMNASLYRQQAAGEQPRVHEAPMGIFRG